MEGTEGRKEEGYTRRGFLRKFIKAPETGSNETQNPPDRSNETQNPPDRSNETQNPPDINLPADINLPDVLSYLLDNPDVLSSLLDKLRITRRGFFFLTLASVLAACIKPSDPEEQFIIKQLRDYLLEMGYLEKGTENYFIDPWVFDLEQSGRATFKGTTLSQIDYQNLLKSPSKELVIVEIPQNLRPLFNLTMEDTGFLAIKVGDDKVIPITWLNPQKLSEIQIPQNDLRVIELDERSILSYIANSIKNDPRVGLRYSGQVNPLIKKAPNLMQRFQNAHRIIIIETREPPSLDQNNKRFLVFFYDNNDNYLGSDFFPQSSFDNNPTILNAIKNPNNHFRLRHSIDLHFGEIPLSLQSILNNNSELFNTLDTLAQHPSSQSQFLVRGVIFDIMIIYQRNQNNYDVLLRAITPENNAVYYISAYKRGGFTHMYVNSAIAQRLTGLTSLESAQSISGKPLPAILRLGLTKKLNSGALSRVVQNYLSKGARLIYGFLPNIMLFIVDIIKEAIQEHQLETYLSSEYENFLSSISQEDLKKFIEGLLTRDSTRVTLFSAIPKSNLSSSPKPFTLIINNSGKLMLINSNAFNLKISSEGLISSNVAIEANVAIEKKDEAKNASLFLQPKTYNPQNPYQVILVYRVDVTPKDFLRILIGDIPPITLVGQIIPIALGIIDVGDYYIIAGEVLRGRVA